MSDVKASYERMRTDAREAWKKPLAVSTERRDDIQSCIESGACRPAGKLHDKYDSNCDCGMCEAMAKRFGSGDRLDAAYRQHIEDCRNAWRKPLAVSTQRT